VWHSYLDPLKNFRPETEIIDQAEWKRLNAGLPHNNAKPGTLEEAAIYAKSGGRTLKL
jgi:hypothetical protein